MTDPRAINRMHKAKMKKMTENQLGMAVGAGMNQATSLVANGIEPTTENIAKVEKWFEALYHLAQHKKNKELETPTQADIEDKMTEEHYQENGEPELPIIEEGQ